MIPREEIKALVREHFSGLFDDFASQYGLEEEFNEFADALIAADRLTTTKEPTP